MTMSTTISYLLAAFLIGIVPATAQVNTQAPPKQMAADADPSFEVATIKPNHSGDPMVQEISEKGHYFGTRNSSLQDLIEFAYNIQSKQIVGGSDWMDKDRYDISAIPNQDGVPSLLQTRVMVQKLLSSRFKLAFHHSQLELSAFVLSVSRNGSKLTPTQQSGPVPVNSLEPGPSGWTLTMRNASIADLAGFLQMTVLNRPVIDQTGVSGRFDLSITFTPDDSQFHGNPPPPQKGTSADTAAPALLQAVQLQLGLKLELKKALVESFAIDHVEKPSPN
jgi:uncharacterized protein (TIGR03435 family)